ncbi:MAG: hypothetical protein ACRDRL_08395 [Sciscionella sp.]
MISMVVCISMPIPTPSTTMYSEVLNRLVETSMVASSPSPPAMIGRQKIFDGILNRLDTAAS